VHLIAYFKYLCFNYLTTLQANTQNNLGFSRALPAAHALQLNAQNCAWSGSQISVICYELSGGGKAPQSPSLGWGLGRAKPYPRPPVPPYLQILAMPLSSVQIPALPAPGLIANDRTRISQQKIICQQLSFESEIGINSVRCVGKKLAS